MQIVRRLMTAAVLVVAYSGPAWCQTLPPPARVADLSGPRFGGTFLSDGVVQRLKADDGICSTHPRNGPLHGVADRSAAHTMRRDYGRRRSRRKQRRRRRSPSVDARSDEACAKTVRRGKLAGYEPFPFHSPAPHSCPRVLAVCHAPDYPAARAATAKETPRAECENGSAQLRTGQIAAFRNAHR